MKKKERAVKVVKDPDFEIPIEVLEQAIVNVSEGMKKLSESRLLDHTMTVLIQNAIGQSNITRAQVQSVLDTARRLEVIYLKQKKGN